MLIDPVYRACERSNMRTESTFGVYKHCGFTLILEALHSNSRAKKKKKPNNYTNDFQDRLKKNSISS